ncbi:MAG: hypothetical protein AD742_15050 [Methylibium sp. NZG]|nr:MAG: hypothetical protein AD742_15050 [Methylibium sp. NZG]
MSALVDGELDSEQVAGACARWRSDSTSRATWHAYQLIGDVLRSEDLSAEPAHDAAFLNALRARLATEPVVLAPQPVATAADSLVRGDVATRKRWAWAAPSAVAAGFVAVAGVLVVTRSPAPPAAPVVASANSMMAAPQAVPPAALQVVTSSSPLAAEPSRVATGQLIRDSRLDQYLAAHKHFAGSAALGVPSAFLRSATVDAAGR